MVSDGDEERPFLEKPAIDPGSQDLQDCYLHKPLPSSRHRIPILLHILFFAAYSCLFAYIFRSHLRPQTALHPIDSLAIKYRPQSYTDFEISPFAGTPSPSLDKTWHDLLAKTAIRVSGEELRRSNQTSVPLPEGGGYLAWLGVYHQLHCIKMLRQWNYRDHYHPTLQDKDIPHWNIHADHCLDILRSAAICHADTTLTTFGWLDQDKPQLNTRLIEHKCVDWDALMESVKHRLVSKEEVAALQNPNIS